MRRWFQNAIACLREPGARYSSSHGFPRGLIFRDDGKKSHVSEALFCIDTQRSTDVLRGYLKAGGRLMPGARTSESLVALKHGARKTPSYLPQNVFFVHAPRMASRAPGNLGFFTRNVFRDNSYSFGTHSRERLRVCLEWRNIPGVLYVSHGNISNARY